MRLFLLKFCQISKISITLFLGFFIANAGFAQLQKTSPVSYDSRAVLVNGQRQLIISGEMHYARSPREMWPTLLDRSKEMGINTVATYIFWDFHEQIKDVYNFSGQRDLGHYLQLCKEKNLNVILRVGPYCCAEWNYGGYPAYLRDEPGITIRTLNKPYMNRVEKYFEHLSAEIKPYLAVNGGPVILVQVENEYANVAIRYGEDGQRYLKWIVELAERVGLNVQKITCEGGAKGAIECVNGHSIPTERSITHKAKNPDQPLIWTELWPAWYNTWGFQDHKRDPRNIAFHMLNFIGSGGTGINYYMWHGGTNFGRTSMYLQTTSYDFDAPLDEYGRPTLKGLYLAQLHKVLEKNNKAILYADRTEKIGATGIKTIQWVKDGKALLTLHLNESDKSATEIGVSLNGRSAIVKDAESKILFDTQVDFANYKTMVKIADWQPLISNFSWKLWQEPFPDSRFDAAINSKQPIEQLTLTKDQSDYCWYSTTVNVTAKGDQNLEITYGGDFFYVYLDGKLQTQSKAPFLENRGVTMPEDPAHPYIFANALEASKLEGFKHKFILKNVSKGNHKLEILAASLGLVKGDWSISSSMNNERKGIWQPVKWNEKVLNNWQMNPFLSGEKLNIVNEPTVIKWTKPAKPKPLTWYSSTFQLSQSQLATDADYRIDMMGSGKGMLFVNGYNLGRYWLIDGNGYGPDEFWQKIELDGLYLEPAGQPTQRYYHLPKTWLKENNVITIFEEQAFAPSQVNVEIRTVK